MNKFDLVAKAFPKIDFEEYSVKKNPTGGYVAKITTDTGTTYIKKISKTGVVKNSTVEIPYYETKSERDEIILDLLNDNHLQEEVAEFLGISQSTVSNVLKRSK